LISGGSQSDYGILVVDSISSDRFKIYEEAIKEQLKIISVFGIKKIIVVLTQIRIFNERFNDEKDFKQQMKNLFEWIESILTFFQFKKISSKQSTKEERIYEIVCVESSDGSNFSNSKDVSKCWPWYSGRNLLDAMDEMFVIKPRETHKPLRISIDKCVSVTGIGIVLLGNIIQGVAYVGSNFISGKDIKISPIEKQSSIKSIHLAIPKKSVDVAFPGDYIGLSLSGVSKSDFPKRRMGVISGNPISQQVISKNLNCWKNFESPLHAVESFVIRFVFWLNRGKKTTYSKLANTQLILQSHHAQVPVWFKSIIRFEKHRGKDIDEANKNETEKNWISTKLESGFLEEGDVVVARFESTKQSFLAIDTEKRCSRLGRVILREGSKINGGGIILETTSFKQPIQAKKITSNILRIIFCYFPFSFCLFFK